MCTTARHDCRRTELSHPVTQEKEMKMRFAAAAMTALFLGVATSASAAGAGAPASGASQTELTIYHIEGRRSQRVVWLCEEIGLPYTLSFKRGDLLGSMENIAKVSPLMHVAPVVRY